MDNNIDLSGVVAAIETYLRAKFPQLRLVAGFYQLRQDVPTPAVLFEVDELEYAEQDDPETGATVFDASFAAHLLLRHDDPHAKLAGAELALAIGDALRRSRYDLPPGVTIGPTRLRGVTRDHFSQELDGYVVWRIEWQQLLYSLHLE